MAATDLQTHSPVLSDRDLISETSGSSPRAESPHDDHEANEENQSEPSVEALSLTQGDEAGD